MKDEYIIINKTAIQKRVEELENKMRSTNRLIDRPLAMTIKCQINELKEVLSQSTPLIPEIEKAFDAGDDYRYWENNGSRSIPSDILDKEDYISNLKLDI